MLRRLLLIGSIVLLPAAVSSAGIYAPAAGQTGSTAIYKDDSTFVEWASGYEDYAVGADCTASWQTPAKALGKAVGDSYDICCLGNGGRITLTFDKPITNGTGWDFAVFENGFSDTFLELGYVEVSSNGTDFFRFPNYSLTASAVGAFGSVDPTNIDGLAGKYRQGYGTPFDLDQLVGVSSLLDVNNVGFLRIQDIVGDGTYFDTVGHVIYDPHKTTGSGGFDLDAVGVIHTVPEPSGLALLASVGAAAVVLRYRRRKSLKDRQLLNDPLTKRSFPMRCIVTDTLRWLLVASVVLYAAPTATATVVDFEDLGPGSNAYTGTGGGYYWNGPDPNGTEEPDPWGGSLPVKVGTFQSGGIHFANRYNTNYGSWGGFAYSNTTDTTTAGYTNQFSAYAGSGYGPGSDNYGVGFGYVDNLNSSSASELQQLPCFELPTDACIQSAMVTNTTYAALSMLQGDGFAKKFGGTSGNDPDWFKLTVYGTDATGNVLSSDVNLYLADYRGASDYIVDQWTLLDLSPLADAHRLYFNLTSSDVGDYGMNTPGYFAIDNISVTTVPEPSVLALLCGAGIVGAIWTHRRRLSLRMATLGRKECC